MGHVAGPVRTCIGCRGRDSRSNLVRLVADRAATQEFVAVDSSKSAAGRGAWVHPHRDCLDRAITRRAIARALRIAAPTDYSHVEAWFDHHVPTEPLIIEKESGS